MPASSPLAPGRMLLNSRLVEPISQGGVGPVRKVLDTARDRRVELKTCLLKSCSIRIGWRDSMVHHYLQNGVTR